MAIDVPTLTVVDAQSGGLVSATVAGATDGTANTLQYQRVDGELGTTTWTTAGSRTGDGAINATVPLGYYWWKLNSVLDADSTVANLVYQPVTDGLQAVQERILSAVQARITLLELPGAGPVIRVKIPDRELLPYPCVFVTAFQQSETVLGGNNATDHWGRLAFVGFASKDAHVAASEGPLHYRREKVFRAFQSQKLAGVEEVMLCDVEPAAILVTEEDRTEYLESGLLLRFKCRELRGFGQ